MSCGCKLIELCNKWNFWCYLVLFYPKELIWSVSIEPVMAKQIYSSEQLWELGCKLSISSYLFIGLRSSYIQYCDRKMVLPGCFMPLNPHGTTASVSMPLNPPICLLHLWLDFFYARWELSTSWSASLARCGDSHGFTETTPKQWLRHTDLDGWAMLPDPHKVYLV